MKVALLSCTKTKKDYICPAEEMYSESRTFRLSLEYAKRTCDKIFILSAKHGLLDLKDVIGPYDELLDKKPVAERRQWSRNVINKLNKVTDLKNDQYIIFAGQKYNEYLLTHINKFYLPLKSLTSYKRAPKLEKMLKNLDNESYIIHEIFNQMPRYSWNDIDRIDFSDGIYIIFEEGENYHAMDRVVRVGTHKADGRLKPRLKDHYIRKNKDGSIFRKNLGLAFLNKEDDDYLRIWRLNTSKPDIKEKYMDDAKLEYKRKLEDKVSKYLQENTSFTCFKVDSKEERLRIEEGIIALLNQDRGFEASENWLGNHHPDYAIRESGLWNKEGLNGKGLTLEEIEELRIAIGVRIDKDKLTTFNKQENEVNFTLSDYKKAIKKKTRTKDIENFIREIFNENKGLKYIDIVSGNIHKMMGLKNRNPMVCGAMYNLQREKKSEILYTTPSGKSSTLKIRYFL